MRGRRVREEQRVEGRDEQTEKQIMSMPTTLGFH